MSREEVLIVESMLKKAGVEDVRCYLDKQGTEESFMSLGVPSPHIIHLATHGFYYTPEDAVSVQGLSGYKNAMMLSGLVLAGGNAEWKGEDVPENTLGGILTAEDISLCDLSNTELVVLTACDTGKGKITPEGVYGLQRAFKKAGAKSIIMSLWKTDDTAAKEFMQLFYESLTTNNWDRHAAFQYAKDKMRNKYRQPYYWAGFIMLD
jgi:CHAT domain-containing protein